MRGEEKRGEKKGGEEKSLWRAYKHIVRQKLILKFFDETTQLMHGLQWPPLG